MNLIKTYLVAIALLLSDAASASFTITSNGFIDSASNLEWLAPSKIQSQASYNTYVNAGWRIATSNNLNSMLITPLFATPTFISFDQSIFNGFKLISNTSGGPCGVALFCTEGWVSNGVYGYEVGWIGLFNPVQTNPNVVEQHHLLIGSSFITSTTGSYPLYGFGNSYSTFMVRAVPVPGAFLLFSSAVLFLSGRKFI